MTAPLALDAPVIEHVQLAHRTYRIRLEAPAVAAAIRPGQFVMLRLAAGDDPLLGRPFALYDTVLDAAGQPFALDIVYLVLGKMTTRLVDVRVGDALKMWGPLGNGFPSVEGSEHVALVAGGIGQTPFLAHIRDLLGTRGYGGQPPRRQAQRVSVYYGVRSENLLAGVEDFESAGATVYLATDDGSRGHKGYVTDLLAQHPRPDHLFGCGPEPMLHALARVAARLKVPCHVSLETPMACGLGICFSCVTKVVTPTGDDYRRVCVDGPIFDAADLVWE
jgi:dihydroorotate dehydrogenase electron transfer subunit